MSDIAIVGSAEVVIRALGDRLQQDIQEALDGAARGSRASGRRAGQAFGEGVGEGVESGSGDVGRRMAPRRRDVDRAGQSIGQRLGDQIGRGIENSRLKRRFLQSLLKLAVIIPILGGLIGGISAIVSGLLAMTAAAGTASAALIVFPGILAAMAQGAAVALVGFKGVGEAIAQGFDPSQVEAFNDSLAKLPPSARAFVQEFVKFQEEFRGIRAAASEGLFEGPGGLTTSLQKIEPLLPRIAGRFRETGQAIADAINSIFDALTTDEALNNFAIVANVNNQVIRDLGVTFGNLGAIIIAVLSAAGPVINEFSAWMADFTGRLRENTEAAESDGSLVGYFVKAADAAVYFIDIVGNIFEGLYEIGQIVQPFGISLLNNLKGATEEFANLTDKAGNVTGIQEGFVNIHNTMLEIGLLARDVAAAFLRMGTNPILGDIAQAFRQIVPQLEMLFNASLKGTPAFITLVGHIAEFLAIVLNTSAVDVFISALNGLMVIINAIAGFIGPIIEPFLRLSAILLVSRGAVALLTFAMRGLIAVFAVNPVGAVILGLLALAAAFKYAWNHSETFREIVAKVVTVLISHFQLLLAAFGSVLQALGKVPKMGWAEEAGNAVVSFGEKLDGAKTAMNKLAAEKPKVNLETKDAEGKIETLKGFNGFSLNGTVTLDTREAAAKLAALLAAVANPLGAAAFGASGGVGALQNAVQVLSRNNSGGGGGFGAGGNPAGTGDKGKKEKEKKETEIDMRPIFEAIAEDTDKFRDAMKKYIEDLRKAGEGDGVKIATAFERRMNPFLLALDRARDRIKVFNDRVKEVTDALIGRANIFDGGTDQPTDFQSIATELAKSRTETLDLTLALRQLRGLGLNNTLLQQLADAGPDALPRAASIVRAGRAGVEQLNRLQGDVATFANRAGREAGAAAAGAGNVTADAFIRGLINQRATLQKQLDILARSMGKQIADTLKKETKPLGFFPKTPAPRVSTTAPAPAPTAANSSTVNVTNIYNGPSTGSSRNRELDWTLRYASPTSSPAGGAGSRPVAVR